MSKAVSKFTLAAGLVLALAFTFSCSGDGDGGGGNNPGGEAGFLTITGLPNSTPPSIPWAVNVFPAGTDISTSAAIDNAVDNNQLVLGITTIGSNVFFMHYGSGEFYKESGSREVLLEDIASTYRATVTFSNGSATVPFSIFTLVAGSGGGGGKSSSSGGGGGGNSSSSSSGGGGYTGCSGGGSGSTCINFKTKKIGEQTWMAENLNCDVGVSKCYDDDPACCAKYGRLYDWSTALTACPSGWHLPSDDEWTVLTDYVGGRSTAGTKLKATSGWNIGNGTNDYEFSALPGGFGLSSGSFVSVGLFGLWWSATELNSFYAYDRGMGYGMSYVDRSDDTKSYLLSVRCVQD